MDDESKKRHAQYLINQEQALEQSLKRGDTDFSSFHQKNIGDLRRKKALANAMGKDITSLGESEIKALLEAGEDIPVFQDIRYPYMDTAKDTIHKVMDNDDKLYGVLSKQINENSKLGAAKIPEITEEIAGQMKLGYTPDVEMKYGNFAGAVDQRDLSKIELNPLKSFGQREGVIAHEIRHLKDLKEGWKPDMVKPAVMDSLYSQQAIFNPNGMDKAEQRLGGKALHNFEKKADRLFPNDKLKPKMDALELYDFMERRHLRESFLKRNLKRLAKGLPLIGAAAALMSDDAAAAIDPLGSTTMDTHPMEDPDYAWAQHKVRQNIKKRRSDMEKQRRKALTDVTLKN